MPSKHLGSKRQGIVLLEELFSVLQVLLRKVRYTVVAICNGLVYSSYSANFTFAILGFLIFSDVNRVVLMLSKAMGL